MTRTGLAAAGLQSLAWPSGRAEVQHPRTLSSRPCRGAGEQELTLQAGACGITIGDWLHPPDRQGASCKVRGILGPVEGPGVVSHRRAPLSMAPSGCTGAAQSSVAHPPPGESPALVLPSHRWRPTTPFSAPFLADFPGQIRLDQVAIPCSRNPTLWPLLMCN